MSTSLEGQYRDAVGSAAGRIVTNSEDPISREFAQDILDELRFKSALFRGVVEVDTDVSTYSPVKRIGGYILVHQKATHDWSLTDGTFALRTGEPYINFHIPPGQQDLPPKEWSESYRKVARYIDDHNIDFKYWLGITYGRLAAISGRSGYTNIPFSVPDPVYAEFENIYQTFLNPSHNDKPPGQLVLCYQTRQSFLNKFGSPGQ